MVFSLIQYCVLSEISSYSESNFGRYSSVKYLIIPTVVYKVVISIICWVVRLSILHPSAGIEIQDENI